MTPTADAEPPIAPDQVLTTDQRDRLADAGMVVVGAYCREELAQALHVAEHGPWISGQGLRPGGTPWGTTREAAAREEYLRRADTVLTQLTGTLLPAP